VYPRRFIKVSHVRAMRRVYRFVDRLDQLRYALLGVIDVEGQVLPVLVQRRFGGLAEQGSVEVRIDT